MGSKHKADISEYYRNKNIFLTGVTGFIGKAVIEKLIRSCPDIGKIYCLIRPKKFQDPTERLAKICSSELFALVVSSQPDFASKIHAVPGDLLEEGLGLRESDKKYLQENINIVIHSAATIRFVEKLKLAVQLNVVGVRRLIILCKGFKNLEAVVHVSSAYTNCEREFIEEMIYPPPIQPIQLIDAMGWMDDELVDEIEKKLIGNKPNTYTYTKHIAEALLKEERGDLPIAIVRPSIVVASLAEPLAGWLDRAVGCTEMYLAAGKGILHTYKGGYNCLGDIIPVDFVSNLIIATAWYTAIHRPQDILQVYHLTSGDVNPVTWGEMEQMLLGFLKRYPMESCFRLPTQSYMTQSSIIHNYKKVVSHWIPAYVADFFLLVSGKKTKMVNIYKKLHFASKTTEYFLKRQWRWNHTNTSTLMSAMTLEDQKTFYVDPQFIDWQQYLDIYGMGIKKFILKEDPENQHMAHCQIKL